ncbi:MAG: hypothetical protein AB3N24_06700 [Leisingera sp.]
MNVMKAVAAVAAATVLAGCQELEAERQPETTPPEYYPCRDLPAALAQADAVVRNPVTLTSNERNYWFDRKDRLIKRAWECKA